MKSTLQSGIKLLAVLISLFALTLSQGATAQGNSGGNSNSGGNGNGGGNGNAFGKTKNIGVGNASDGISASIITAKDIFYTGDPLSISLRFNRGADLVSGGTVDAYVVVFSPATESSDDDATTNSGADTENSDSSDDNAAADTQSALGALSNATVLPVSSQASSEAAKLFEIEAVDVSALPAGTYQLGLILTNPGGDPLVINDWFKGLLGLIDIVGLTVSDEALPFDADGDGEVDDDADGDGFSDDQASVSSSGDSSSDSSSSGS